MELLIALLIVGGGLYSLYKYKQRKEEAEPPVIDNSIPASLMNLRDAAASLDIDWEEDWTKERLVAEIDAKLNLP